MINKINTNKSYFRNWLTTVCLIFLTSFANNSEAQNTETETDSFNLSKTLNKAIINNEIIYNANDSMRFDILNRKVLLYGNAFIKYENTD